MLPDNFHSMAGVDVAGEGAVAAARRSRGLPQVDTLRVGALDTTAISTTRTAALAAELREMVAALDCSNGSIKASAGHHVGD